MVLLDGSPSSILSDPRITSIPGVTSLSFGTAKNEAVHSGTPYLSSVLHHWKALRAINQFMPPGTRLNNFVKGYELSDEKIGEAFDFDGLAEPFRVNKYFEGIIGTVLDYDAYLGIAVARNKKGKYVFIIVLDDGTDEEELRKRPLPGPLHSSLLQIMEVLDGPDVYLRDS